MKRIIVNLFIILGVLAGIAQAGQITSQSSMQLYSKNISTITDGAYHTVVSSAMNVKYTGAISVTLYGQSESTNALTDVDVEFSASYNGSSWDTTAFTTFSMVLGTNTTQGTALIDTSGIHSIRVLQIYNGNAADKLWDVNVIAAKKG